MTTKRRMPVNVLQGLPPAQAKDPVLDDLVGAAPPAPERKKPVKRAQRPVLPALAPPTPASPGPTPLPVPGVRAWGEARRLRKARQTVRSHALWSAAVGIVPVPLVAGALLLAIQGGLARALAADYGLPGRRQIARCLAAGFVATAACLAVSPAAAWALRAFSLPAGMRSVVSVALSGVVATYFAGRAFVQDAEAGGTLLRFDPEAMREFFRRLFTEASRPD